MNSEYQYRILDIEWMEKKQVFIYIDFVLPTLVNDTVPLMVVLFNLSLFNLKHYFTGSMTLPTPFHTHTSVLTHQH